MCEMRRTFRRYIKKCEFRAVAMKTYFGEVQGVHQILCFFQEFSKVGHLSLASTRLLLVVQKIPSQ